MSVFTSARAVARVASSRAVRRKRRRGPDQPADEEFLCFEVEADGFLYNMVRAIIGTLVKVGRGKWPPDRVPQIIAGQDRSAAGETAPPHGLYLVRVRYPGDES